MLVSAEARGAEPSQLPSLRKTAGGSEAQGRGRIQTGSAPTPPPGRMESLQPVEDPQEQAAVVNHHAPPLLDKIQ